MLEGHLQDYWFGNMEPKDETDPDALEDMRIQSDTAVEVFRALFADHQWFQDETRAHTYLRNMKSPRDERILSNLLQWTNELISTSGAINRLISKSAQIAACLSESIEPFIKMGANLETIKSPSLWPIVEVVR